MNRDERRVAVAELAQSGLGVVEISQRLGTSRSTVHRDWIAQGIVSRNTQLATARAQRRDAIGALCQRGLDTREIARRLGVSPRVVCRDRIEMGLPDGNAMVRAAQDRRREIVASLCHQGLSTSVIAATVGVDDSTVQRDRIALGIADVRSMGRDDRRDAVVKLCHEGWTAREIAAHLGTATRTIERDKDDLGLSTRKRNHPITADEHRRAQQMLADGESLVEVARTLGRNPSHIGKLYRGQGWTPEQTGQFNRLRNLRERLELIDGGC